MSNKANKRFRDYALQFYRKCQYCNQDINEATATVDHIIPRSKGGSNHWSNMVLSCEPCNSHKGNCIKQRTIYGPRWTKQRCEQVVVPWTFEAVINPSEAFLLRGYATIRVSAYSGNEQCVA